VRKIEHSTMPAIALPRAEECRDRIPNTSPVIVTGSPMIGRNHATMPTRPSTMEVFALPERFCCAAAVTPTG
jgi:hypothetical protein